MRNRMKNYNIGLWAISFAVAVALWGYVTWILNPQRSEDKPGIMLEIYGEEEFLSGRNLCIIEGLEETFTLTFVGSQADLNRLNKDTVRLRVDVSGIRIKGDMSLGCELILPDEVGDRVEIKQLPTVRIVFDNVIERDIGVVLKDNYDIAEGYVALTPVFQPSSVRVKGPESIVNDIDRAEVELASTNINSSIENEDVLYALLDEKGERIGRMELLTVDIDSVLVSLPIEVTKEVPLRINFMDGGGLKENDNIVCKITPSSITLSGTAEVMEELNAIYLYDINLAELEDGFSDVILIPLPENVRNLSGTSQAEVSVTFNGVRVTDLSTSNISLINEVLPEGCKLVVVSESRTIRIRGPEEIVGLVQPHDIRVVADLDNKPLTRGMRPVPVQVYIDGPYGNAVGVMGSYDIIINVVEDIEEMP